MVDALYAGSFDPITFGHVDVIQRASNIFDKVFVAISINTHKHALFTPEERADFVKQIFADNERVNVLVSEELTVHLAKRLGTSVLVRGVRGSADLDSEMSIAGLNSGLAPDIQTVFLPTAGQYRDLSSSMIKEIAKFHGEVSAFVPPVVSEALKNKF
ncbi:MAG: pantetheine-phosphate adenylyltransferase [Lentilactobacillus hilgardii]|jgi:pantetheine-phosphate adenylyltransferase|uniref:Phosphopantetheine adenylyltransferase n=1 Tax=Lentilactobacillus hilgardii TaxID=1588 RepID=A0A6P1E7R1_LENHI|nr:pantetheine-phosphate adenylyltransferase [Lentilactobacillus hilgardii]RRG08232.1 MAG: pantetheine-phosphate adenylyltransferase [Lactobacillus sp.]EEI71213.1 pantetheine-phosphate adenylyltransferase [Lentilactobacillus hilgardii ATCC 27305]MBZ2200754.1 pantetheine-phosphate adenylyltransferase [Lentilactobacillus hilgardii]MBZ2203431.1 pantetheine-phosphate adenylyltransferase [Lentilactobacillus hilgardii]MCT3391236.1 pantetheine-phosphate adenylyltransferase [Lentilactobacillus hilgard